MLPTAREWIIIILISYQAWIVSGGIAHKNCTSDEECPSEIGIFGVTVTYKCGEKPKQFYMAKTMEIRVDGKNKNLIVYVPDPTQNSSRVCECDKIGDVNATLLYFDGIQHKTDSTPKECGIAAGEKCLPAGEANNKISRGCASLQCLVDRKPEICEGVSGEFVAKVPRNSCKTYFHHSTAHLVFIVFVLMINLIQKSLLLDATGATR